MDFVFARQTEVETPLNESIHVYVCERKGSESLQYGFPPIHAPKKYTEYTTSVHAPARSDDELVIL